MIIENDDDLKYYAGLGLDTNKFRKTGAVYQDVFFEILNNEAACKKRLYTKYKIADSRPVILCNLFPVGTPVDKPYTGFSYGTLGEAVNFWLDPLLKLTKFQVWLTHHPRTKIDFVKYLENYDLKVIYEPIEDIIPFCDLYVTGVSATTRMALTVGKPIVCFTEGQLYTDLDNFKSVLFANNKIEYLTSIEKLEDEATFDHLKSHGSKDAVEFGPIDGNSYSRIKQLIDQII